MRSQIRIGVLIALSLLLLDARPAVAQLGGIMGVGTIAHAQEQAVIGDYFAIEGTVTKSRSRGLYTVQDESGEMLVLIPEFITREVGVPELYEKIRVSGKFDRKKLDHGIQGMRVARLERLGKNLGGRGATSEVSIPEPSAPPAARSVEDNNAELIVPVLSEELKRRLSAQRMAFDAANEEVEEASGDYAKALYQAGENGEVSRDVQERMARAEAHRDDIAKTIPPLVEEARKAGVAPELLKMYENMTIDRKW